MPHFDSVEQVVQALTQVGYSKEEIDHILGKGWDDFDKRNIEYGIEVSPSDYIMGFIRAKELQIGKQPE